MALVRISLGAPGLRYLTDYLGSGVQLAQEALQAIQRSGEAFTYLPPEAPEDIALVFGSARALHPAFAYASVEDWGKAWADPAYPLSASGRSPLVDEVLTAAAPPSSVLRCANDIGVHLELHAPLSRDQVEAALLDAYVMGTFVAAVFDDEGVIRFIGVEAYDGEGFVGWKDAGPAASV